MPAPSITIGGSESAAAVGLDPYCSRVELWASKTGLMERKPAGEAAAWGNLLQPVIAREVEARGYVTMPAPADALVGEEPWMTGHLDGYCANGRLAQSVEPRDVAPDDVGSSPTPPSRGVLEVKTCGPWVHGWENDGAPPAYVVQTHWYMHLTGLEWALLACLVAGQRLELRRIERDDALLAMILEASAEFVGYVERNEPPPPDGSAATDEVLKRLYPQARERTAVNLTADDMLVVGELRALKDAGKETERQIAEREQLLKLRLGEAEYGVWNGETVVRWQTVVQHRKASEARDVTYRRFSL